MRMQLAAVSLVTCLTLAACGSPQETGEAAPLSTATQGLQQRGDAIRDQFIVVLQDDVPGQAAIDARAVAEEHAARHGGELLHVYEHSLKGYAIRLSEAKARALASDPRVKYVEPDRVVTADQGGATWGLDRTDQRDLPLSGTYRYDPSGSGVHAYIIDTGIRTTHSEFGGRAWGGYTAVNDGNGTNDCNGHGTHVAGTVGGRTWGMAKNITLHPVRVLDCSGSGSTSGVIAGVDWVTANHASPAVANMSLGGGASQSLDDAVARSIASGVTYAIAAGNSAADACNTSPARAPAAITVGATESDDARAWYSNWGTCLDLFAPGSGITSSWNTSDTATNTISGTSMATPHVTGAAALYLSTHPGATPGQVRDALVINATANKVSNPGSGSPNRLLYTGFLVGSSISIAGNNTFDWGWGNVTNVKLGGGDNVISVPAGATVSLTANFSIDAGLGGCPGCISQLVFGVNDSKQCVYNGGGTISSSAGATFTAPSVPGTYVVWASGQWQYSCADAVNAASTGGAVGLIEVYADPFSWGWGSVSNVMLNGKTGKRVRAAPGAPLTLTENYFIDASLGGCPGCISQIVMGIADGSKQCVYNGTGVVYGTATGTLTAPTDRGIYKVWANNQWQYSCADAANAANDGSAVSYVEVDTCSHDKCTTGVPLVPGCDNKCVQDICAVDSHCCGFLWDSTCVAKVATVCHQGC